MATKAFMDALYYGHRVVTQADLYYSGSLIVEALPVVSGSVSVDRTRAIKRQVNLKLVDPESKLRPFSNSDRLTPYGAEILVRRGVMINGEPELIPMGLFRIANENVVEGKEGVTIEITGYDRSRAFALDTFDEAYVIEAGTSFQDAIDGLLTSRLNGAGVLNLGADLSGTITSPQVFEFDSDPWKALQSLVEARGCEIFFDAVGRGVIRNQPDPSVDPAVDFYVEGPKSKFTTITNSLNDDPGWNGVRVFAEPPNQEPIRAAYFDNDPNSPTFAGGAYGRRAKTYRTTLIYTQAQADNTARSMFLQNVGITEQVKFDAIPNPALDAGDVVEITRTKIGIADRYLVDQLTIPLDVKGTMSVVTRKRRRI